MDKLRISQIQFSASHIPNLNAKILEQNFKKTLKFKPHLICTPECSNIITNDKNFLLLNTTYQNTCPVLKMAKNFAKKNKVNINLGSLLLKVKKQRKLVNRSFFIDNFGVIKKHMIKFICLMSKLIIKKNIKNHLCLKRVIK